MNCDDVLILIYDLVDGEISSSNESLLNNHLANCVHCQATLISVQKAEKIYKEEVLVNPRLETSNALANSVWARKNILSFPLKHSYSSTKKILYYIGAVAASFVGFIYLAGSLAVSQLITRIDFSSSSTNPSINNPFLNTDFGQLNQIGREFLALLLNINPWTSQSALVKTLAVLLTLLSLQFAVNYLFTQNKQDKNV